MNIDHPIKTCLIKDIENLKSTEENIKNLKSNLYEIIKSVEILIPREKRCLWIQK